MSLQQKVDQLNRRIANREILEAFEEFYGEDVVMTEDGKAMVGKDANRERERAFVNGLTKWDARLVGTAVDEESGAVYNEWRVAFDHEQWGAATLHQVAAQKWEGGRIVSESFFKL